jgi:maltose O-acetyltransferase
MAIGSYINKGLDREEETMHALLNALFSILRGYRRKAYIADLVKRGLKIGKNTHIMDGIFLDPSHCFLISIGDNCTLAPNVRLMAHDASMHGFLGITRIGKVIIEDNCFIGDSVLILPGVRIGHHTIIGAGSVVLKDIPSCSVAAGNPARVICGLEEFLSKHKKRRQQFKAFPENEYMIDRLTPEKMREMIEYLEKNEGYMKDEE